MTLYNSHSGVHLSVDPARYVATKQGYEGMFRSLDDEMHANMGFLMQSLRDPESFENETDRQFARNVEAWYLEESARREYPKAARPWKDSPERKEKIEKFTRQNIHLFRRMTKLAFAHAIESVLKEGELDQSVRAYVTSDGDHAHSGMQIIVEGTVKGQREQLAIVVNSTLQDNLIASSALCAEFNHARMQPGKGISIYQVILSSDAINSFLSDYLLDSVTAPRKNAYSHAVDYKTARDTFLVAMGHVPGKNKAIKSADSIKERVLKTFAA